MTHEVDKQVVPEHVAIIMDGNGRWAKKRMMPRYFGHKHGVATLKQCVRFCKKAGIQVLTVYAFSTENWQRPAEEVGFLLSLMKKTFRDELDELASEGVRIQMIGDRSSLDPGILSVWENAEERTKPNESLLLNVAFNYGGRNEIVNATKRIASLVRQGSIEVDEINETLLGEHLYTSELVEPDLLIRTGGEQRFSNFLLWQTAYTEWYVTDTLWPDFDDGDFEEALASFSNRECRFGSVLEKT